MTWPFKSQAIRRETVIADSLLAGVLEKSIRAAHSMTAAGGILHYGRLGSVTAANSPLPAAPSRALSRTSLGAAEAMARSHAPSEAG